MHSMSEQLRRIVRAAHPEWTSAEYVLAAADELDRLHAIVSRLPVTADGVLAVPGMTVYLMGRYDWPEDDDGNLGECVATGDPGDELTLCVGSPFDYEDFAEASETYSTKEASIEGAKKHAAEINKNESARTAQTEPEASRG